MASGTGQVSAQQHNAGADDLALSFVQFAVESICIELASSDQGWAHETIFFQCRFV